MSTIDLNNPPPHHQYNVSIEREETSGERRVRLFKDVALFSVAIGFVVAIVWLCYRTVVSASATAEEKKWAMSVLSAVTGGIVGYLVRK
ncbi:hypothetical protein N8I74_13615 [Chitiniphilus purpureus]|uniref:Transmembrane protein n=1 Tax=Chitiniphilus purpureus TaxID=2981137 RepID=A0ABY6DJ23_9NEIS|nr:hypothetical protein [Chitiniphilus sp. CD1]UXY14349.1 hypothetical protein N8I74_13615 [Chitiniphilus sp. CD1]